MDIVSFLPILAVVLLIWNLVLTAVFIWMSSHYRRLVKGAEGVDLKKVLDKLLKVGDDNSKAIAKLGTEIARVDREGERHLQRIGLVRYNPFGETGGAQSFSLCLLDLGGDGFIISGLHARDRTRVYTKVVRGGKAQMELSSEERKALSEALK